MKSLCIVFLSLTILSCNGKDEFISDSVGGQNTYANGCEGAYYPNWQTSLYVLPYPVGQA